MALMLAVVATVTAFSAGAEDGTIVSVDPKELRLWYSSPAPDDDNREWKCQDAKNTAWETLALPVANSYLGAKIFGLTDRERIQINENSLSTAGGTSNSGTTNFTETYIHFNHELSSVTDYERDLVLNDATSHVEYTYGGVTYTREYFASYPDKVMVIKLTASGGGNLDFTLEPTIPYFVFEGKTGDVTVSDITNSGTSSVGTITLEGNLPGSNKSSSEGGYDASSASATVGYDMDFEAQFRVLANGGTMSAGYNAEGGTVSSLDEYSNGTITVSGADSAYIIIALGTNYELDPIVYNEGNNGKKLDSFPHPHEKVAAMIEAASEKSYDELRAAHVTDYTELFDRAVIDLGAEVPAVPTDELMDGYRAGEYSTYIEELMFAYGRYMLISSSREGNLPPNLNGIWNRYHAAICKNGYWANINIQMNYWSAFNTDLAECFDPFIDLYDAFIEKNNANAVNQLIKMGAISSASEVEGNLWSMETGTTPFVANATPGGRDGYGNTPYMAESFWDLYEYTQDEALLREVVFPTILSSANFLTYVMQYDEETGLYLAPNSGSPEQSTTSPFLQYVNDHPGYLPEGATYDQSLTYSNYLHVLEAVEILGESSLSDTDMAVIARIREQIDKLDPVPIGLSGQIKEFREEEYYGEIGESNHRHISHLTTLYPGSVINSADSPAWLDAAIVSLDGRGESFTWGWSHVIHVLSRARTHQGNEAYNILTKEIINTVADNLCTLGGGNFQVEANLGTPAAILEMLMQSHEGYIEPLAALPDAWAESGAYSGLIARGNFEVAAEWENGVATLVNITSRSGGEVSVKYNGIGAASLRRASDGQAVSFTVTDKDVITFDTEIGETYIITGFEPAAAPDAPESLSYTTSEIREYKLAATGVGGAKGYNLYVAAGNSPVYTLADSSVTGFFTYSAPEEEKNARTTFAVTAVDADGNESARTVAYSNPADTSASVDGLVGNIISGNKLQITVLPVGNAESFKVYYAPKSSDEYTLVAESAYPIITIGDYSADNYYYVSAVSSYDGTESEPVQVTRFGSVTTAVYNAANILDGKEFVADSRATTTHKGTYSDGTTCELNYDKLTDGDKTNYRYNRFSTYSSDGASQTMDATVDLGGGYILDTLTVWDFNSAATTANFVGNTFVISVYSLGEWTTVYDYSTNADVLAHRVGTKTLVFDMGGVRAEKINVYATNRVGTNSISIYEIECTGVVDSTEFNYSDNILLGQSFVPTEAALAQIHADSYGYQTLTDASFLPAGGRFSTKTASTSQIVDATVDFGGRYSLGEIRLYDFNGNTDPNKSNPTYMGTELLIEVYANGVWSTALSAAQSEYAAHRVFVSSSSGGAYLSFDLGDTVAEKMRIYIPKNYTTGVSISIYEIECSGYALGAAATVGDEENILLGKEFVPGPDAAAVHNASMGYDKLTDGLYNYSTSRLSTKSGTTHIVDATVDLGGAYVLNEIQLYDYNAHLADNQTSPTFAGKDLKIEALVDGVWVTLVDCVQSEYGAHRAGIAKIYESYLSFDLGGVVAEELRIYQSGGYSTNAISYFEIVLKGAEYIYPAGKSNRDNILAGLEATTDVATDSGYPVSNLFDGTTSTYTSVGSGKYTVTASFDGIKVLNDLSIYEIVSGNILEGNTVTASPDTEIEVLRDGVWLTVYDGLALSDSGRTAVNMLGIDCEGIRITFNNTRLFDGESEYRGAKIAEISCTTATEPVDRTALLESYKTLEALELGSATAEMTRANALVEFMTYLTALNATQEEIDSYTAEIDSFVSMMLAGENETVEVTIGHSCSFQNDISVNYYIPATDLEGYTGIYLLVEREKLVDGVMTNIEEIISDYTTVDGNLKFTYRGIAACEMGDVISARLYAIKDGKSYVSTLDEYSVESYAYNRLAASSDEAFKALLVDMLNYGAAAQLYFGYNAEELVNAALTDEQKALATVSISPESIARVENTVDGAAATFIGQSVVFNNNVELKYYMRFADGTDVSSLTLLLTYTTVGGVEKTVEINGEDFVYVEAYGAYSAKYTDIAAADMSCEVKATVYSGINAVSNTMVYSIESYVANRLAASSNEAFKTLVTEMYKYSESAKAYFTGE